MPSDTVTQATSAGVAAVVTALIFYPLDVVKTRLNAGYDEDGKPYEGPLDVIRKQLERKGFFKGLYTGMEIKVAQDVVRSVSFFYVFVSLKTAYRRRYGKIDFKTNLLLGYLSATVNLFITMPFEVLSTRLMTGVSTGVSGALKDLLSEGGLRNLYSGLPMNFVLCLNPAIKHMIFDQVKYRLLKGRTAALPPGQSFLLGLVATMISSTATFPAARARALLQSKRYEHLLDSTGWASGEAQTVSSQALSNEGQSPQKSSVQGPPKLLRRKSSNLKAWDIMRLTIKKGGLQGLYKGLAPQLLKGILSSAFMLTAKETINSQAQSLVQASRWIFVFLILGQKPGHDRKLLTS